jgi:hypothetical protein
VVSSRQKRRSGEGKGLKGESETPDACRTVKRRRRESVGRGQSFGNLGTADEAAPAQDERGRGVEGVVAC